jgi:sarcosine oxidase
MSGAGPGRRIRPPPEDETLTTTYDAVVVGLGALGALTLRELARRKVRALGLDRHHPPHPQGSSHGRTRIIRAAYFEHPLYVPLVREAWDQWEELEKEVGSKLFQRTGALMVGDGQGSVIQGTLASARLHGIPHRVLSSRELRTEVPRLRIPQNHEAVYEEGAGVLFPERAIEAALESARRQGAAIRSGQELRSWVADGEGVTLITGHDVIRARTLILAPGPWMQDALALGGAPLLSLEVERQVSFWFDRNSLPPLRNGGPLRSPELIAQDADDLPVVLWEFEPGRYVYLIPDIGDGMKAALHHGGERVHPDWVRRGVEPEEENAVRSLLNRLVPGVAGSRREASVCLYTNTPDGHFLAGRHPGFPRVLLLGGGSGHAFKFAPALATRMVDIMAGLPVRFTDANVEAGGADPFAPARLGLGQAPGRKS